MVLALQIKGGNCLHPVQHARSVEQKPGCCNACTSSSAYAPCECVCVCAERIIHEYSTIPEMVQVCLNLLSIYRGPSLWLCPSPSTLAGDSVILDPGRKLRLSHFLYVLPCSKLKPCQPTCITGFCCIRQRPPKTLSHHQKHLHTQPGRGLMRDVLGPCHMAVTSVFFKAHSEGLASLQTPAPQGYQESVGVIVQFRKNTENQYVSKHPGFSSVS